MAVNALEGECGMCEIDWAAAGTWAAVVVALSLGFLDKLYRIRNEAAEAKVIALLLDTELSLLTVRTRNLGEELSRGGGADGLYDHIAATEAYLREDIASHVDGLSTANLESMIGRLHVLPSGAVLALLNLLTSIRELRLSANVLRKMDHDEASENVPNLLPHMRDQVHQANQRAVAAETACRAVAAG